MMAASGALIALPSWARAWKLADMEQYSSSFNDDEKSILNAVADAILPSTHDKPGAKSTGTDLFLQRLFDRCYEGDVQNNIKTQLKALNNKSKAAYNASFSETSYENKITLLNAFSTSTIKEEKDFFNLVKSETIRGFTTCEEVMTQYLHYKVVPGHYYGCVDVNS